MHRPVALPVAVLLSAIVMFQVVAVVTSMMSRDKPRRGQRKNNVGSNNEEKATKQEQVTKEQEDDGDFVTITPSTAFLYKTKTAVAKTHVQESFFAIQSFQTANQLTRTPIHVTVPGFVVDGLLTPEECQYLVQQTEQSQLFSPWTSDVNKYGFRQCSTIECFRADFADILYRRLCTVMTPEEMLIQIESPQQDPLRWQRDLEGEWKAVGTNECLLFSRYCHQDHFAAHTDGFNILAFDHRSFFSIVLYLNDVKGGGGETTFFSDAAKSTIKMDHNQRYTADPAMALVSIPARMGRAVVFYHNVLHQSEPIVGVDARKYIIRSDVMYMRNPPVLTSSRDVAAFKQYQEAEELAETDPDKAAILYRKAFKASTKLAEIYGG